VLPTTALDGLLSSVFKVLQLHHHLDLSLSGLPMDLLSGFTFGFILPGFK